MLASAPLAPADTTTWSVVALVPHRRWQFFGLKLGTRKLIPVRIDYHPQAGFQRTRLDGRPLEPLDATGRRSIETAEVGLLDEYRKRHDLSARYRRTFCVTQTARAVPAAMVLPYLPPLRIFRNA